MFILPSSKTSSCSNLETSLVSRLKMGKMFREKDVWESICYSLSGLEFQQFKVSSINKTNKPGQDKLKGLHGVI
jgi:hypothetical protein